MFKRLRIAAVGLGLFAASAMPAFSQGTLRIGMTAADIPLTTGPARPGLRGFPLRRLHDLRRAGELGPLEGRRPRRHQARPRHRMGGGRGRPAKRWIFKLRQGVKFHDGSDFDADVVIWNLEKILNDKSPQFDPKQAAQSRGARPDPGRLEGDRQVHGRAHDPHREFAVPLRHVLHLLFEPQALGRARQGLGQGGAAALRHRPVQGRPRGAARAPRAVALRRLLGQGPRAQARQGPAVPDAGSRDPHRGACWRARSTGSKCRRPTPSRASSRAA